jgi:DNA-binding response OmpR family regulator
MSNQIVVVEDDTVLASFYTRIMKKKGYEVRVSHDGPDAIELIDEVNPDVIILDILLESTTGFTLLHELQSHDDLARIPVIAITSLSKEIEQIELERYGIKKLLDKETMTPESILQTIQSQLHG